MEGIALLTLTKGGDWVSVGIWIFAIIGMIIVGAFTLYLLAMLFFWIVCILWFLDN